MPEDPPANDLVSVANRQLTGCLFKLAILPIVAAIGLGIWWLTGGAIGEDWAIAITFGVLILTVLVIGKVSDFRRRRNDKPDQTK